MTNTPKSPDEDVIREHSFDGIQEYDKRLPNWWLLTFYGAIAFWIGYWFYTQDSKLATSDTAALEQELGRIEAVKLASSASQLDDGKLWQMSRNAVFVDAGRDTFNTTCASCHQTNLKGVDAGGIGPNLVDDTWIHGGLPTDIFKVVDKGVLEKGMPAWGPVIGAKKTSEVVAYILSHHTEPK
jgi:cytochrome c oxidase cbb3-type subunit III